MLLLLSIPIFCTFILFTLFLVPCTRVFNCYNYLLTAGCWNCGSLLIEGDGEYVATGTELFDKIVVLGIICFISCFLNDGLSELSILF